MNIAFDMHFTKTLSNQRGIGRYSHNMIQSIKSIDRHNTYFDFYPNLKDSRLEEQLKDFLTKNSIDIFHITSPFEANAFRMLKKGWFQKTRLVVTLYDLIPLLFYSAYLRIDSEIKWYLSVLDFIKSCDAILSISETTKRDAVAYAHMDPGKIKVISGGVDSKFKVIPNAKPSPRLKITKPHVIYTGGDDFRKNLRAIIQGFAAVNNFFSAKYQLVLAGDIINKEKLYGIAAKAHLSKDSVIMTGYIADDELIKLYNSAELFIYPSLYEGLGLPVLEAMACGLPVLTSNNSSLHEISGDAAYKINPESKEELIHGLSFLLSQPAIRELYRKKGLEHAKKFQWAQVAQRVIDVYNSL